MLPQRLRPPWSKHLAEILRPWLPVAVLAGGNRKVAAAPVALAASSRSRRRWRWRRRALWLSVRLAASEKAGDSCEKASARWLSARRRISLGKLFLECADSTLRVGHSLLHHEKALDQHVRSRRNLSDLAPDQLISFGILALAIRLAEPIEQTGYEIMFFGCHSLKKTLFSTLTSLGRTKFKRVASVS